MIDSFVFLTKELWGNRKVIISMSKKEFHNQYAGSAFGMVWSIVKPLLMVAVYWFVFSYIRGVEPNKDYTTLAHLVIGLFAWNFLADSLLLGSSSIRDNSYLVKKVAFPISVLPVVKIGVSFLHHLIFGLITIIILLTQQVTFSIYALQIIYYMFAAIILMIALTRFFSVFVVLSIDVLHFLQTIMQVLLWATPVLWDITTVSSKVSPLLLKIIKLNPFAYIVEGYRDSLLSRSWFWEHPAYLAYFWGFTIVLMLISSKIYQKNREEFADVL